MNKATQKRRSKAFAGTEKPLGKTTKIDFASMTPEERDALRSVIMREKGSKRT